MGQKGTVVTNSATTNGLQTFHNQQHRYLQHDFPMSDINLSKGFQKISSCRLAYSVLVNAGLGRKCERSEFGLYAALRAHGHTHAEHNGSLQELRSLDCRSDS
jgi:hypothetical protein